MYTKINQNSDTFTMYTPYLTLTLSQWYSIMSIMIVRKFNENILNKRGVYLSGFTKMWQTCLDFSS